MRASTDTIMTDLEALHTKAAAMPEGPGVYLMKDASGRVIYVGKARSLRKRTVTYFQKVPDSVKTSRLVSLIADLDCILTDNEKEALILENSLIKKHKPRYNINLRDDKTYPYISLTVQEDFPRIEVVRRIARDGAVYFGPFSSATAMRQTIGLVRRLFPLRQCRRPDVKAVDRPCLNFQMGRCLAPCHGHVTREEYRAVVEEVILFFKGRNQTLTDSLRTRMKEAAARLNFEAAAKYRDRLSAVERTLERQKMVSASLMDRDVFGLAADRGQVMVVILFIRQGTMLGAREIPLGAREEPAAEVIESVLGQYYSEDHFIPKEVLVPVDLENQELLQDWLRERRGRTVRLLTPQRGEKKKLMDLARQNAATAMAERLRAADLGQEALEELARKLGLPGPPKRIEGYDLSTLGGEAAVGAMVVLDDSRWVKSDYRRFKIKSASGRDDYAMMSEIINRRLVKEDLPRPDLMLLDGGRGQLGVALAVIEDLDLKNPPPMAGLAKGREGEADKVWLPGRKNPVDLKADAPGLLLLMRVRDEAHRYVQSYHHRVRAKGSARSVLDDCPGIGPTRRKALLKHFGSLKAIKNASPEEIAEVKGMNKTAAQAVADFLESQNL